MDPNSTPTDTNVSQNPQPVMDQVPSVSPINVLENQDLPDANTQPLDQPSETITVPAQGTYIEEMGDTLGILLAKISESDELIQEVADEMEIDLATTKTILTGLLGKINNGEITSDELALIMAAPVVEEPSSKK